MRYIEYTNDRFVWRDVADVQATPYANFSVPTEIGTILLGDAFWYKRLANHTTYPVLCMRGYGHGDDIICPPMANLIKTTPDFLDPRANYQVARLEKVNDLSAYEINLYPEDVCESEIGECHS